MPYIHPLVSYAINIFGIVLLVLGLLVVLQLRQQYRETQTLNGLEVTLLFLVFGVLFGIIWSPIGPFIYNLFL